MNTMAPTASFPILPTTLTTAGTTPFSFIQNEHPDQSAYNQLQPLRFSNHPFLAHEPHYQELASHILITPASVRDGREPLMKLREYLDAGRAAYEAQNWGDVASSYRTTLEMLEEPYELVDRGGESRPLFQVIRNGKDLYREAVFAFAAFTDHKDTIQHLQRLEVVKRDLTDDDGTITTPEEYARAEMLRAYALMRYTSATNVQRVRRYEEAERIVEEARELFDAQDNPDLRYASDFLLFELYSCQMERAHHRNQFELLELLIQKTLERSDRNLEKHVTHSDSLQETASLYEADLIRLLARMNLWGLALERARTLTTERSYATSAGAKSLLTDPFFAKFVITRTADGTTTRSFKTVDEIKKDSSGVRCFIKQAQAAFATAHSSSFWQSVKIGGLTLLTTMGLDAAINGGVTSIAVPALAAASATAINRVRNGWNTTQAKQAGKTGIYERTLKESAVDVAKGAVLGGLETGLWLAPSSLIPVLPEAGQIAWNTFGNAAHLYGSFFQWVGNGIANMSLDTITPSSNVDLGGALYTGYLTLSAAQYSSYILLPQKPKYEAYKKLLKKTSLFFVPGAVLLGAEAGMAIAGDTEFLSRIGRGSIALGGGVVMLLTAGVVALARNKSIRDCASSLWNGWWDMDHNSLVAIGLSYGISSAMGGQMQGGTIPTNPALVSVLGAATLMSLLPIVFGISGIMKGNISFFQGIGEGWQESKGLNPFKRVWHAVAGAIDAFNTTYVYNRGGRVFHLDILPATARTYLGFDTNKGAGASEGISALITNPTATTWQPETGRSMWETEAILRWLRGRKSGELRDHWRKAGQRMPLEHIVLHQRMSDRVFPLKAIGRAFRPPIFPLAPQAHYFAGVHQMLTDLFDEEMTQIYLEEVAAFALDAAQIDPDDADSSKRAQRLSSLDVARELLKTAYIARNDPKNGHIISDFFDSDGSVLDVVALNPEEIPVIPVEEDEDGKIRYAGKYRFSRHRRAFIRSAIAPTKQRYRGRIAEHAARAIKPSLTNDLFHKPIPPVERAMPVELMPEAEAALTPTPAAQDAFVD